MKYQVNITATAILDLREIALYIFEKSKDREIAKRFIKELQTACKRLEGFPSAGSLPRDHILLSKGYRYIIYKDYLIFYLIDESKQTVSVHSIFNAKKDYMREMRKYI